MGLRQAEPNIFYKNVIAMNILDEKDLMNRSIKTAAYVIKELFWRAKVIGSLDQTVIISSYLFMRTDIRQLVKIQNAWWILFWLQPGLRLYLTVNNQDFIGRCIGCVVVDDNDKETKIHVYNFNHWRKRVFPLIVKYLIRDGVEYTELIRAFTILKKEGKLWPAHTPPLKSN